MNDNQLKEMQQIELKIKKLQVRLDYLKALQALEEQEKELNGVSNETTDNSNENKTLQESVPNQG